jgi:hypothetical protein
LPLLSCLQGERDVKDIVQALASQEGPYTVERYTPALTISDFALSFIFYYFIIL